MQSKFLFLFLAISFSFSAWAQKGTVKKDDNVKIKWGEDFKFPKKHLDGGFFGDKENGLVQVCIKPKKDIIFLKYDLDLKPKGQEVFDLKNYPKDLTNEGFLTMRNHLFWLYSVWDKKNEKEQLYVLEFDRKSFKPIGKSRKILDSKRLSGTFASTGSAYGFAVKDKYSFYFNHDSTKVAVKYRIKPEEKDDSKNKDVIGIFVFDENFNKSWGREVKMPFTEAAMDNLDYQIDNSESVYILIEKKAPKDKKDKEKKEETKRDFKLLKVVKDSKELEVIDIDAKLKYIRSLGIYSDNKGSLKLLGFYSNEKHGVDGILVANHDGTKFGELVFNEIPDNVIKQFESIRSKKKMEKRESKSGKDGDQELYNLEMDQVVFNSDGTMTVTAEEWKWTMTIRVEKYGYKTTYHYYYKDIYIIYMDNDGEMIWVKKIPKSQNGSSENIFRGYSNANTMSYYYHYHQGNHYVIFMDNAKNANLKPDQEPASHVDNWGGMVTSVRIDPDGNMYRKTLFDVKDLKRTLRPREFNQVTDDIIINIAYGRGQTNPVQIKFQDKD